MALVAWHRLRTCASVDLAVAFDFTLAVQLPHRERPDYQGEAPEAGCGDLMAKKKKRPRQRPPSAPQTPVEGRRVAPRGRALRRRGSRRAARETTSVASARRKRDVCGRRSDAARDARRRLRRTFTSIGIAAAAVAAITPLPELPGPERHPSPAAIRAAEAAGCTEVDQPARAAHRRHSTSSAEQPTTTRTGPRRLDTTTHRRCRTTPKVYDTQPPETRAVHSLEHGAVFVYYLPEADGGLSQEMIDRLTRDRGGDNGDLPRALSHAHPGDRAHAHRVEPTAVVSGEPVG